MSDSVLDARAEKRRAGLISSSPVAASAQAASSRIWPGSWRPQHVIDEIGRDRDLAPRFDLARMAPLDQPGDDAQTCGTCASSGDFGEPRIEIVAQHVLVEQLVDASRPSAISAAMSRNAQTASA